MAVLQLRNTTLRYGGAPLLDEVDFQIDAGERVCLIGRNGAGKTSLMRVLTGEEGLSGGELIRPPGTVITRLEQEVPADLKGKVWDVIHSGVSPERHEEEWETDYRLSTLAEEMSLPGAALARCAAPERFFEVASALMLGQDAVFRGGTRDAWYAPAVAVSGRTRAQLDACAATPATLAAISRDVETAQAAGATSTPSFFVNGRRVTDRTLGGLEVAIRAAAAGQ